MPDERTPEERSLAAQVAANTRWYRSTDRVAATKTARDGLRRKYENEVDPDRVLSLDPPL